MAYWLCMKGSPPHRLIPGRDVTIGRGQRCDLSVYSSLLSREHACIRWEGEQPVLFDLESLNGIFIGPDRIHRHELREGDVIRMGDMHIVIRVSERPPKGLDDEDDTDTGPVPPDMGLTPVEGSPGSETRFFNRTAALHQRLFEYDELGWLREQISGGPVERELAAAEGALADGQVVHWYDALGDRGVYWRMVELGLIAPRDRKVDLRRSAEDLVRLSVLTKRAERLQTILRGGSAHWNEMAALRYKVRQGPIFKPIRQVARAYRPSGGLTELDAARLHYELENIYAYELGRERIDTECRRLLVLGFFSPQPGVRADAWYPQDWSTAPVEISRRGVAMLEGFRFEDA